jgi:predicted HTH transcriptional regulator
MKFVATKDFANVRYLSLTVPDAVHPRHVHKGARFSIGGDQPFGLLPQDDQQRIKNLRGAGCIIDDTPANENAIKYLDNEVVATAKKAAELKARNSSSIDLLAQVKELTEALKALAASVAPGVQSTAT